MANRAEQRHRAILGRFLAAVERWDAAAPLRISEIARAIGTSTPTLNHICRAALGMSTRDYVLRWRLRGVRTAIEDGLTVTQAAALYGFWSFGWMSGKYRKLYGELPSATKARSQRSQ